jgi:hypothetical protein
MKRYRMDWDWGQEVEFKNGEWVKYEDAMTEIEAMVMAFKMLIRFSGSIIEGATKREGN